MIKWSQPSILLHAFKAFYPFLPTEPFLPFKMSTVFKTLLSTYTSWPALKAYLSSDDGGRLRVYDDSATPDYPYALIRYVKGQSNFSIPHVGAFRSVVWDTLTNRPVSVTPFKSVDGESLPDNGVPTDYQLEQFVDGVMIGMFFDPINERWQIHTRSTLNANCRFYSQTMTFRDMFYKVAEQTNFDFAALDKSHCYTYVLRHSENRIVCSVPVPSIVCVQDAAILSDCLVDDMTPVPNKLTLQNITTWEQLRECIRDWDIRFRHNVQGVVVKARNGQRWKIRTPSYNAVRHMRGNTPRRDFVWLSAWRNNTLYDYLTSFPEEKLQAESTVAQWKRATNEVFHIYTDVFKARTLNKSDIPSKYRPLVYGLHSKFMDELKPAGKSVDWKTTLQYMNERDTAQMLFVINWEKRQAAKQFGTPVIPIEPPSSTAPAEPEPTMATLPPYLAAVINHVLEEGEIPSVPSGPAVGGLPGTAPASPDSSPAPSEPAPRV